MSNQRLRSCAVAAALATMAMPATAEPITVAGQEFPSWSAYFTSDTFRATGARCGAPDAEATRAEARASSSIGADCSASQTNPTSTYDPAGGDIFEIPVVVHVITNNDGTQGNVSDEQVQAQIDVLNEDFRAMAGTAGADGVDCSVQFHLATVDPDGLPTNGITRTANDLFFNDSGSYWNTLGWDPKNYCNIYVNSVGGGGILGYVPFLPQSGQAATAADRIVVLHSAFGRPASGGPPYNLGRTLTHEMGHFLGLFHTFEGECSAPTAPACYTSGDLICDTASEAGPHFQCEEGMTSCSTEDPIHNYMDYSVDACMYEFTSEQAHRMRCTLMTYRATLYEVATPVRSTGWKSIKQAFR